jgi:hypothetical protein
MRRRIIYVIGAAFGIFNLLPIPWSLRLLWMKLLYFITVKGTSMFPSILSWTRSQNVTYKMGKQEGEDYESLVQLEKVLEHLDMERFPAPQVKRVVEQAEAEAIPPEQLGVFIAQATLTPESAERVLRESLREARY